MNQMNQRKLMNRTSIVAVVAPVVVAVVAATAGCDLAQPFEGPGYSLSEGLLSEAPGPFVVGTTWIVLSDDPEAQPTFDKHMSAMIDVVDDAKGLVGKSLSQPIGTEGYRTLTVWESEEDMLAWVVGETHAAAMSDMADLAKDGKTTSWTMTRDELAAAPPSWDEAKQRLDDDGVNAY